jgi:hypothetical protein
MNIDKEFLKLTINQESYGNEQDNLFDKYRICLSYENKIIGHLVLITIPSHKVANAKISINKLFFILLISLNDSNILY